MRKEQEKMGATIASAVERTLASALKGVVQTALKAMSRGSDAKHVTAVTHLKYFDCNINVN